MEASAAGTTRAAVDVTNHVHIKPHSPPGCSLDDMHIEGSRFSARAPPSPERFPSPARSMEEEQELDNFYLNEELTQFRPGKAIEQVQAELHQVWRNFNTTAEGEYKNELLVR